MKLLALTRKEFLVKIPLTEKYLDGQNSTYVCNLGTQCVLLGYDHPEQGFKTLPVSSLLTSERYIKEVPTFDFSIFMEDDFRESNSTFTFVADRLNSLPPPVFNSLITNVTPWGVYFETTEPVFIWMSIDGVNYNIIGDDMTAQNGSNYQPNLPDCYLKLSNYTQTLFSPVVHYIPQGK